MQKARQLVRETKRESVSCYLVLDTRQEDRICQSSLESIQTRGILFFREDTILNVLAWCAPGYRFAYIYTLLNLYLESSNTHC